jgi:hypothetical protein
MLTLCCRIVSCPEVVALIVGPEKSRVADHKALLGFKSEYLDALLFGGFTSNAKQEIDMENELPEAISIFVSWAYTGRISDSCRIPPEALWIMGDRLRSPGFMNDAMHQIFAR